MYTQTYKHKHKLPLIQLHTRTDTHIDKYISIQRQNDTKTSSEI